MSYVDTEIKPYYRKMVLLQAPFLIKKKLLTKYKAIMKRIVIFLKVSGALETSVQSGTEIEMSSHTQNPTTEGEVQL